MFGEEDQSLLTSPATRLLGARNLCYFLRFGFRISDFRLLTACVNAKRPDSLPYPGSPPETRTVQSGACL